MRLVLDEDYAARAATLTVFRKGLAQGVDGPNHLAYHVEVGNGLGVREFVFVDAHMGKVVAQFTGIHDAILRKAFDGEFMNLLFAEAFRMARDGYPWADTPPGVETGRN